MADSRLIATGIRDTSTLAFNELIDRMGTLDITPILVYLIDDVPASALPHLAEQFHVTGNEGWLLCQSDADKRALIKAAISLHRRKGTPAAIKQALAAAGYGDVIIVERPSDLKYNGAFKYDGQMRYGPSTYLWATYHIILPAPITSDQAAAIRALCEEFAPVRCRLTTIMFPGGELSGLPAPVPIKYNGMARYNGKYTYS